MGWGFVSHIVRVQALFCKHLITVGIGSFQLRHAKTVKHIDSESAAPNNSISRPFLA